MPRCPKIDEVMFSNRAWFKLRMFDNQKSWIKSFFRSAFVMVRGESAWRFVDNHPPMVLSGAEIMWLWDGRTRNININDKGFCNRVRTKKPQWKFSHKIFVQFPNFCTLQSTVKMVFFFKKFSKWEFSLGVSPTHIQKLLSRNLQWKFSHEIFCRIPKFLCTACPSSGKISLQKIPEQTIFAIVTPFSVMHFTWVLTKWVKVKNDCEFRFNFTDSLSAKFWSRTDNIPHNAIAFIIVMLMKMMWTQQQKSHLQNETEQIFDAKTFNEKSKTFGKSSEKCCDMLWPLQIFHTFCNIAMSRVSLLLLGCFLCVDLAFMPKPMANPSGTKSKEMKMWPRNGGHFHGEWNGWETLHLQKWSNIVNVVASWKRCKSIHFRWNVLTCLFVLCIAHKKFSHNQEPPMKILTWDFCWTPKFLHTSINSEIFWQKILKIRIFVGGSRKISECEMGWGRKGVVTTHQASFPDFPRPFMRAH